MTSTYDHRIIQGAESGRFLQTIEALLQGERRLLRGRLRRRSARARPAIAPPQPQLAAAAAGAAPPPARVAGGPTTWSCCRPSRPRTALVKAYRTHGHLAARLDPLGTEPTGDPALDPDTVRLTPELMAPHPAPRSCGSTSPGETLAEALPHLREAYCGTIAYEIEHLSSHRSASGCASMIETGAFREPLDPERAARAAAAPDRRSTRFERFLHKAYLGPEAVLDRGPRHDGPDDRRADRALARRAGAREVVIGMAHRGRLSVLAHNLGRPFEYDLRRVRGHLERSRS